MKTLQMIWRDATTGRSRRVILRDPKDDLTSEQVQNVMSQLKEKHMVPDSYDVDQASVIDRTTNELFNLI
ncbi:MAG: DUF2922 domain-containing protein [Thermotogae bacterium]|nr:DUF2922 domain-containing protein [Thermotogota bacterium]